MHMHGRWWAGTLVMGTLALGGAVRADAPPAASPLPTVKLSKEAQNAFDACHRSLLLDKLEEGVLACEKSLSLAPDAIEAHKVAGVIYMRLKRPCEAKKHYQAYVSRAAPGPVVDRVRGALELPELKACP